MNAQREVVYKRRRHACLESDWNRYCQHALYLRINIQKSKLIISKNFDSELIRYHYFTSYRKWIQEIDENE
jgi:hypothetical protein